MVASSDRFRPSVFADPLCPTASKRPRHCLCYTQPAAACRQHGSLHWVAPGSHLSFNARPSILVTECYCTDSRIYGGRRSEDQTVNFSHRSNDSQPILGKGSAGTIGLRQPMVVHESLANDSTIRCQPVAYAGYIRVCSPGKSDCEKDPCDQGWRWDLPERGKARRNTHSTRQCEKAKTCGARNWNP